jgi:hypothetical protein
MSRIGTGPLGVRVSRTGVKTFIVILHSGRRHKIGRYGDITLGQAREAARPSGVYSLSR